MNKRIQLFFIPFAGGSSTSFNELCSYLDNTIESFVVEYPGRGTRNKEPFAERIDALVCDVKNQIVKNRNRKIPFALFGYSMGTAIAYDLAQYELEEKPIHLFAGAREALYHDSKSKEYVLLDEGKFTEKIRELGGIDSRIADNRRFLDIYMRPIYADYKLWNQYMYQKDKGLLDCGMTVFYSEKDTPYERVEGWHRMTRENVDFYEFEGTHFFIQEHAKEMADIINKKLSCI